jgi:hypothetical protein
LANISHQLMIKYGLRTGPSQALVDRWVQLTESLISQGVAGEQAGTRAAVQVFPDYQTHIYASESDTITSLLGRAKDKD